jgi:hypothetical protein
MPARATRWGFLIGLASVPALAGAAKLAGAARAGAAAMRPGARGRSGAVCAACGAGGHTMLDPACPADPKVV